MKKLIALIVSLCLLLSLGTSGITQTKSKVSAQNKEKLLTLETELLELLRGRHKIAGEGIDIRAQILEAKQRAVPENQEEMTKKIKELNVMLREKNAAMKAKTGLITTKTSAIKRLLPKKKTYTKKKYYKKKPIKAKK